MKTLQEGEVLADSLRWQANFEIRELIAQKACELVGAGYCFRCEDCRPYDPKDPTFNCGLLVWRVRKDVGLAVPDPSPHLLLDLFDEGRLTKKPVRGDLVFRLDREPRHAFVSPRHGFAASHGGFFIGGEDNLVIHAAGDWRRQVVEESLDAFCSEAEAVYFVDSLTLIEHPEALPFEGHM